MAFSDAPGPQRPPKSPRKRAQVARLAALALLLYGRGRATGDELASKLGVTLRTIYRDVSYLQEAGFPIVSTPGPSGGFVYGTGEATEGTPHTDADLLDLLTRTGLLATDETTLDAVLRIASDSLDVADRIALRKIGERVVFDHEEWYTHDRPTAEIASARSAVLHERRLRVSFTERGGPEVTRDTFDPYGMVWKGGFWYLFGFSHRETRFRRIRLQRILSLEESGDTFAREPGFDLLERWRMDLEDFGKGHTRVRLRIDERVIPEFEHFNWKTENKVTKHATHWEVEMNVDSYDWLSSIVLAYGGDVTVLEPQALREKIALSASTILRRHAEGADLGAVEPDQQRSDIPSRASRLRHED